MLNRWIERGLLDVLGDEGVGCIVFSPLAQGMLTDRYLDGIPADSRASRDGSLSPDLLSDAGAREDPRAQRDRERARADAGADGAGLDAARPARDLDARSARAASRSSRTTSARSTTSTSARDELAEIDRHATDSGINLWAGSSDE